VHVDGFNFDRRMSRSTGRGKFVGRYGIIWGRKSRPSAWSAFLKISPRTVRGPSERLGRKGVTLIYLPAPSFGVGIPPFATSSSKPNSWRTSQGRFQMEIAAPIVDTSAFVSYRSTLISEDLDRNAASVNPPTAQPLHIVKMLS
jgi:hypothetical protein